MKIGIIGSGAVAKQLGFGFLKSGYDVKLGTRHPAKLADWLKEAGEKASVGSFEDAAKFGEMVVIAALWADGATRDAINMAGRQNLAGKVVMDVTNPLASNGKDKPPRLDLGYSGSAGATIQSWLPDSKVVKAFNIISAYYIANPNSNRARPICLLPVMILAPRR